jgi:hypothetical protein
MATYSHAKAFSATFFVHSLNFPPPSQWVEVQLLPNADSCRMKVFLNVEAKGQSRTADLHGCFL